MGTTRHLRVAVAAAVAVVLLGALGCGGDQADTRSETYGMPSILQDLQNEEWVLDLAASTPRIHATQPVTLTFLDDSVHGNGPCNVYRATLDIAQHSVEDHSIEIGAVAGTKRSCGRAVDRAEVFYFAALQAVTRVDVDHDGDRLTLSRDGDAVHLEFGGTRIAKGTP
jgi:heat shock protein HslJ